MSSVTKGIQVLDQGFGYGMVIGIGAFFAILMLCLTYLQNRYTSYSTAGAEEFSTASRSVKPGLIAAGIVSSWTWSATLLTSSTFAYSYGISGGMWYAANGTLQILLFGLIAIKIKAHAPGAHTFPEIVLSRHGHIAHLTYLFFGWATNMLVGACLVLGGSQVVSALSGVNVYAACWLIPFVVAVYVVAGGLRSTFVADYTHTAILFIAIFVFGFNVYLPSGAIGGIDKFYDLLLEASDKRPIAGNFQGSYLTFKSNNGLIFAVDLLIAGFSNVWLDQAYWQRAIASRPQTSVKAYIAGGIAWYGIPFGFATAVGLGCAALTNVSVFPTYPNPLSVAQNGAGLSAPATAIALLGKGGAGLMLLLLFMAVTSSTSAELIAVSSLLTFDVYKTYIRPNAQSTELVKVSHYAIVVYAVALAAFCCILNAVSIDLTWILTVLGVIVGGAALPIGLILTWERLSFIAAVASPWISLCFGLTAWLVVTKQRSGSISVSTTGDPLNAVAGNIASLMTGLICSIILSFIFPAKYTSTDPAAVARAAKINGRVQHHDLEVHETKDSVSSPVVSAREGMGVDETPKNAIESGQGTSDKREADDAAATLSVNNGLVEFLETSYNEPMDPASVRVATRLAVNFNIVFFVVAVVLVPFTLFGSSWIFSRAGFRGWCVVSFIWVWVGMFICVIWPLLESRHTIAKIARGIVRDVGLRGHVSPRQSEGAPA